MFLLFKILYIMSAIRTAYTDEITPSVYTDCMADGIYVISNYYQQQKSVGIDWRN
jgi:hypothetical protein